VAHSIGRGGASQLARATAPLRPGDGAPTARIRDDAAARAWSAPCSNFAAEDPVENVRRLAIGFCFFASVGCSAGRTLNAAPATAASARPVEIAAAPAPAAPAPAAPAPALDTAKPTWVNAVPPRSAVGKRVAKAARDGSKAAVGAVAFDPNTRRYGIAWGTASEAEAVEQALATCGSDACVAPTELVFGPGECAALARPRGDAAHWAVARGEGRAEVADAAVQACRDEGRGGCVAQAVHCEP
jgi:hypothetical protein